MSYNYNDWRNTVPTIDKSAPTRSLTTSSSSAPGTLDFWGNPVAAPASGGAAGTSQPYDFAYLQNDIHANTSGRGDATLADPYLQSALDRLSSIQSGADEPYTQQVQDQLLSRQGDSTAAAAGSQAQQLQDSVAASGGNASDPSYQAAMRGISARQQQTNNANLGDMQTRATLANFDARNQATNSLTQTRANQLSQANAQYNQRASYDAQTTLPGQHTPGFSYTPEGAGASGGYGAGNIHGSSFGTSYGSENGYMSGSGTPTPYNYTGPIGQPGTGTQANPSFAMQDPYGGQGAPPQGPSAMSQWAQDPMAGLGLSTPNVGRQFYTPPGAAAPSTMSASERTKKPVYNFNYQQ